jgi:pimeloyl-ACP methyl ester carboxylesterase
VWDVEPLPDSFGRPVRSKIPTLVLTGSLDPITPAADAERAAKTLKNGQYFEFAGFGHAVTKGTDCPRAIRQVFLDDPDVELVGRPEVACAKDPAPAFLSQGLI